jgi:hypothetical protein
MGLWSDFATQSQHSMFSLGIMVAMVRGLTWSALDEGVSPRVMTPNPGDLIAPEDLPKNFDWRAQTVGTTEDVRRALLC